MSDAEYSPTHNTGSVVGAQQFARKQERKAVALALVAGAVDAYGIITYHTYLSYMSGNTTQTGYKVGQGDFAAALPSALAIVFFVAGSFAGSFLAHSAARRPHRLIFGSVAALLALIIGFTQFGFLSDGVHIAVVSFAMGVMNLALTRIGKQRVSLTFVSGTLRSLGEHLALAVMHAPLADSQGSWDTHSRRAGLLGSIWSGFLAGALLSGAATPHIGAWILLLPIVMLSALGRLTAVQAKPSEASIIIENL
jgi:uncharacterized membrane protein YoaK (UPF0700 family)